MTPYEIMLSESQERMLLVVKAGREAEVERIFEKWDLHAVRIGDGHRRRPAARQGPRPGRGRGADRRPRRRGARLRAPDGAARLPEGGAGARAGHADRRRARPRPRCSRSSRAPRSPARSGSTASTTTWSARTRSCWPAWAPASCGSRARRARWPMSVDGNGRYGYLDPERGAMLAVAEAARNVACAGARAGRRDQLPELRQPRAARDHVAVRAARWTASRRRARRSGCADHRRQRQSLQRDRRPADRPHAGARRRRRSSSTPTARSAASSAAAGSAIVLLGENFGELGGSEYLKIVQGLVRGRAAADRPRARARPPGARGRAGGRRR